MPNQVTVEETVSEDIQLINPFCQVKILVQKDLGQRPIYKAVRVELDEKTHMTHPVIEAHDLVAEIQSCKDLAGVDYMKKLLLTGQAKPSDFYDDGKGGVDTTLIPVTPHEALEQAQKGAQELANLAKALGVEEGEEISASTLEKYLSDKVKEIWNEQLAKAQAQSQEGGDK